MKKTASYILAFALGAVSLASCQQQNISLPVDFNVTLDGDNVYRTGEIVRFRFSGDADYITFYSGETGHEWDKRERTSIPTDEIKNLALDMKIQPLWGRGGGNETWDYGFRIYLSKDFKGLESEDGYEQRAQIKKMVEDGEFPLTAADTTKAWRQIWNDVDCESVLNEWKYGLSKDIIDYADNFCIAFHWHPWTYNLTANQRSYHVQGDITMEYGKGEQKLTAFTEVPFTVVTMNEEDEPNLGQNPKLRTKEDGSQTRMGTVNFGQPNWDINFEGAASSDLTYELDAWCISDPMSLNAVSKDSGVQIKSLLSPILTYEHTYTKPGTYKAVFYGVNDNYQGRTTALKEVTVIVVDDKPFADAK